MTLLRELRTVIVLLVFLECMPILKTEVFAYKSRLYFLSIGNGFYKDPVINIDGLEAANHSAQKVTSLLRDYGVGKSLISSGGNFLTKKIILNEISRVIDQALKDTASMVIIYYCGHRTADFNGNLYLVPGDISSKVKPNQKNVVENYLSIRDIQNLFIEKVSEMISEEFPFKINLAFSKIIGDHFSRSMLISNAKLDQNSNVKIDSASIELMSKVRLILPRILFLADCCYDDILKDEKKDFYKYSGSIMEYLAKQANDGEDPDEKMTWAPEWVFHSMANGTRSSYQLLNGVVMYSTTHHHVATFYANPDTTEVYRELGAIARRVTIFFADRAQFTFEDLMESLSKKDFDQAAKPALFENNKENRSMEVQQSYNHDTGAENYFNNVIRKI